ncbi:MAG: hypothetical protein AB1817_05560 [Chloroflexota bacterium]
MKTIRVFVLFLFLLAAVACDVIKPAPTPVPSTPTIVKPSAPITFASGQIKTWSVATDDAFVYWTDCGNNPAAKNGKVMRAPKSGGALPSTAAQGVLVANESCPTALALDADNVYFLANDPGKSYSMNLKRVAKTGGAAPSATAQETLVAGQDIRSFAVDDANVYWTICDLTRGTGAVSKMSKQGGAAAAVIDSNKGCFFDVAVDAANVYWIEDRGIMRAAKSGGAAVVLAPAQFHPRKLVLDETNAYWIADAYIMQIAKTGGAPPSTPAQGVLVAGQKDIGDLAVDRANVYWTGASGALMKIGKTGSTPSLVATAPTHVHAIAVDDANIFWTNLSNAVMKIDKAGGAPVVESKTETTTLAIAQANINSFAIDDASVYWTTCRYDSNRAGRGAVVKVSKNDGALTTLATDQICPKNVVVDATNVYWIVEGRETAPGDYRDGAVMTVAKSGGAPIALASKQDGRAQLAADDVNVYWTDCGTTARKGEDGAVFKMPKTGGAPQVVVTGQYCPGGVAADATNVYWQSAGTIYKVDKRGGTPPSTVAQGALAVSGGGALVLDDANVYWARNESASRTTYRSCADERSALYRVSKNGGVTTKLADWQGLASVKLAMDAQNIYWANDCANGIWKITKTGGEPTQVLSNVIARHIAADATHIYWVVYEDGTVMKKAK